MTRSSPNPKATTSRTASGPASALANCSDGEGAIIPPASSSERISIEHPPRTARPLRRGAGGRADPSSHSSTHGPRGRFFGPWDSPMAFATDLIASLAIFVLLFVSLFIGAAVQ